MLDIGYKARKMQSENRKFLKRAMLAREFIFFTQHLGRVQLLSKNIE